MFLYNYIGQNGITNSIGEEVAASPANTQEEHCLGGPGSCLGGIGGRHKEVEVLSLMPGRAHLLWGWGWRWPLIPNQLSLSLPQ